MHAFLIDRVRVLSSDMPARRSALVQEFVMARNKNHEDTRASKGRPMIQPAIPFLARAGQYLVRVVRNDSTKRGLAAAGAGVIMSLIIEAWPASRAG
jgi:hypothetical protein